MSPKLEERLASAFEAENQTLVREILNEIHPADSASFLHLLDAEERERFLKLVGFEELEPLMEYLNPSELEDSLETFSVGERRQVLEKLSDDDLADFLQEANPEQRGGYIDQLSEPKKEKAKSLLEYDDESAGGWMTTAMATIQVDLTIRDAIDQLREQRDQNQLLSRIFVVDADNKFLGRVRLSDLTFNKRSAMVRDIVEEQEISILASADQEDAARMISKYDLLALPVVDENEKLLGVITHDDAMDIVEEESTEDMEKISAIAGEQPEESYIQTTVLREFQRRFGWALVLAFAAILSGVIIYRFEPVLNAYYVLALYMPMLVSSGGNTGSQTATMVIRAMSLGEITSMNFLRVIWKEVRIGLLMGAILGICIGLQILFYLPVEEAKGDSATISSFALIVSLALMIQVTTSTFLGATLPILAKTFRLDPAVVASPAITTLVDATGMLIYFGLAKVFLL